MSALIARSTQLAQPNAPDDGDALALRYGAEVSLRGARGLGLSVAPVREADDVVFEAAVGGLNLGAADERFVVCNAMVRDDKGPVRYGDVVGLRSRLARGRCLGVRDAAFAGEDEVLLLPCGHYFHKPCIDRWFATKRYVAIASTAVVAQPY